MAAIHYTSLLKDTMYLCCATSVMGDNKQICTFVGRNQADLPLFTSDSFYTAVMSDTEPNSVVSKIPCPFILDPTMWSFYATT
jgi:hypothetical protein